MIELGLRDAEQPIPVLNDNSGAIDWTKTGDPTSKKTWHMNIQIKCHWVPGKENPSDLFTKEHKDGRHFQSLRDLMIVPLEEVLNIPTAPAA